MLGTGLQELIGFVYGADTVKHMLAGKAVSRALRAHLLIQSALTTLQMEQIIPNSCQQSTNDEDSALTDDDIGHLLNLCATVSQAA